MTSNQISYWANKEKERNNRELERISDITAQENARHNKAYEEETKRHNIETEKYGYSSLAETNRHNLAIESISAQEAETKRLQEAAQELYWDQMATISAMEAEAQMRNAEVNAINAATRAREVEYNNVVNLMNADTNRINARTNEQNATTNLIGVKNDVRETQGKLADWESQAKARTVQNVVTSVNTGVNVVSTAVGLLKKGILRAVLS